jgi:16S rRNA G966 N2-methylase RsmD
MDVRQKIFGEFDFRGLNSSNFKEDSVREELITPLLNNLGYDSRNIVRSKQLQNPFVQIGTTKRPISQFPDYLLKIEDNFAWVLDAKAPNENIRTGKNVEQVYSYAIHPEIRTRYFALCNGRQFVLFRPEQEKPVLCFDLRDIDECWERLSSILSPDAFQFGKTITYNQLPEIERVRSKVFNYLDRPLLDEIPVRKQTSKRHFGVHGYFTKQSWNVVQEYIRNFSRLGDIVLDPFGGSGVTLVEALMTDRKGIHIDLNPMSVFIVDGLIAPIKIAELGEAFERVKKSYHAHYPKSKKEIKAALQKYPYPKGFQLPRGSDVHNVEELFTEEQLAHLAILKWSIKKEKQPNIQKTLLLMFSGLLNKVNLTYHSSAGRSDGRGNSSVFAYYRYRIAKKPAFVDIWTFFESRLKKVIAAKKEIEHKINEQTIKNAQVLKGTATDLQFIKSESIDYIYTDPPYGKKIPYLDLSTMWNAWLDLKVTERDYAEEAIEGGEHNKSKEDYGKLIKGSIEEMYRVLKFDRWMSFVFAHQDPALWYLIVYSAETAGFEYAGAVKQSNGQSSFKKRQHPFTVLQGQLIINFKKVRNPKAILKANLGMKIGDIIIQTIEGIIAKNHGATLEEINDELIIKGLELGFLDLMKQEYSDLTSLLTETFEYSGESQKFFIRENQKFKTHLDVRLKIRYYVLAMLRRAEHRKDYPTFDEIVFHIIPLLKNGITPEKQTVLSVLEDIGERIEPDKWRLRAKGQIRMFD